MYQKFSVPIPEAGRTTRKKSTDGSIYIYVSIKPNTSYPKVVAIP
jgi:hypothetical protein